MITQRTSPFPWPNAHSKWDISIWSYKQTSAVQQSSSLSAPSERLTLEKTQMHQQKNAFSWQLRNGDDGGGGGGVWRSDHGEGKGHFEGTLERCDFEHDGAVDVGRVLGK